eukprot:scaffold145097_cov43-Attheya_sp.AAC.1
MLLVTLRVAWYDNVKVEKFGNDNHLDKALEPNEGSSSPIEHSSDLIENSPDDVQEQMEASPETNVGWSSSSPMT